MMADDDNDNDMADDDNDNAMAIVPELAAIANGINAQQARINEQTGINDAFDGKQESSTKLGYLMNGGKDIHV